VIDLASNRDARDAILRSIREHLAASAPFDAVYVEAAKGTVAPLSVPILPARGNSQTLPALDRPGDKDVSALVHVFSEELEAVGGHCLVVQSDLEIVATLTRIISDLQATPLRARRLALSDAPGLEDLVRQIDVAVDEITVAPTAAAVFDYDLGITTAQAAIAETGTLVLESECERHRLASLVPPVHIAIVDAASICLTLGEALAALGRDDKLSPTITFITGPSRTADIELTLAIGVHGPQELYVIVREGPRPTTD
jgi:L-lactate dehydrogenase complex protein LldG